jgi:hypothetical protein
LLIAAACEPRDFIEPEATLIKRRYREFFSNRLSRPRQAALESRSTGLPG